MFIKKYILISLISFSIGLGVTYLIVGPTLRRNKLVYQLQNSTIHDMGQLLGLIFSITDEFLSRPESVNVFGTSEIDSNLRETKKEYDRIMNNYTETMIKNEFR